MIANLKGEEGHPLGEFFERWPDNCAFADDATSTNADVCQVTTDYATRHDDSFATEDDVLAAADRCVATHLVAARCLHVLGTIIENILNLHPNSGKKENTMKTRQLFTGK